MAKQGLASLAPPHLQERAAERNPLPPSAGEGAPPKSRLAALAAERRAKADRSGDDASASAQSVSTAAPAKPLSKLQQKMAAARAAKEQPAKAAAGVEQRSSAQSAARDNGIPQKQDTHTLPDKTVSGQPLTLLFPLQKTSIKPSPPKGSHLLASSSFGSAICRSKTAVQAGEEALPVPGGSPFAAVRAEDERLNAFAGPSPDDEVLIARGKTRLAT